MDPQETAAIIQTAQAIFTDAELRILAAEFLSDFRAGKLTLAETVDLVIQIHKNGKQLN